jgi:sugar transferase EpsL
MNPNPANCRRIVKRCLDLAMAVALSLLLLPVLLTIAALVRIKIGSPVLFRQRRAGYHGRPFTLYKFRSMTEACDRHGRLLPDYQRMTPLGKWMRSLSLDELPQLWNVLRGELSFVGPRPLLLEYLDRYTPEQARRHEVLPGISGWAQVNGRNAISWEERFALDVWYVDHWSLGLDVAILGRTIGKVVGREGICSNSHATMAPFEGSRMSDSRPDAA